jgi:hypothetical protein
MSAAAETEMVGASERRRLLPLLLPLLQLRFRWIT